MKKYSFGRKGRLSAFTIVLVISFFIIAAFSLFLIRDRFLNNVQVMGMEVAARFSVKESMRFKMQELVMRNATRHTGQYLKEHPNIGEVEIEKLLKHHIEYVNKHLVINNYDFCAVINGKIYSSSVQGHDHSHGPASLSWYNRALLVDNDSVVYSNLYREENNEGYALTVAKRIDNTNNVLAMHIYPTKLDARLQDNWLPNGAYYYLCDANGRLVYSVCDRKLNLDQLQPYVDHILLQIRQGNHVPNDAYIIDLEGTKRGVYYSIGENGWISIVTIPYTVIFADYNILQHWFVAVSIGLLLLAGFLFLRERRLKKQMQDVDDALSVLAEPYFAVFKVDLSNEEYKLIGLDPGLLHTPPPIGKYQELVSWVKPFIEAQAAEDFEKSFNMDNIRSLLDQGIYDYGGDFRGLIRNQYIWISVRMVLVYDQSFQSAYFFFKNIDEEKRRELERMEVIEQALKVAKQNIKARNMFFSAMSHDMRTPLNGIIGLSSLVELNYQQPELVKDYAKKIKSSGQQLLMLINDILEMSRLESGKVEHIEVDFEIKQLAEEVASLFNIQIEMERKVFHSNLELEQQILTGDAQSLRQILNNLLSNAVKYTTEGSSISFTVTKLREDEQERLWYAFIISDNGIGMSKEFLAKIFEPFARDNRFKVGGVSGTGLGMPIVKGLVERMEGSIDITSAVNEGTCVTVTLPFTKAQPKVVQEEAVVPLSDFAGTRVLVAEDNAINMEIVTELLKMNGLQVAQAVNGKEAVDAFSQSSPCEYDIVLMDVQMPVMDGIEATKAIRSLDREDARQVPIIALTGSVADEEMEEALKAGMNAVLPKPLQLKQLAKAFQSFLKQGQK